MVTGPLSNEEIANLYRTQAPVRSGRFVGPDGGHGLDRGQLGATKVVRFLRSGPKILLVEDNLQYRASSDNADERRAIAESFARSVLWGFTDIDDDDDSTIVDATAFFVRDAHGVAARLEQLKEGKFSVDVTRSAIYLPRTRAFPDNTEVEAIVTFVGEPSGKHLPTVVPDHNALTVHVHHSLIRLPDDGYLDYGTAIGESLVRDYGRRHRLEKIDPTADVSEAVEPVVYYLDRGVPEPVRTALLDGASWWAQAFEAAGYQDAYRVELLPEGADPMDVRYNVIQWVRSSRATSRSARSAFARTT